MRATVIAAGGAAYFPAWSKDGAKLYVPTQGPDGLVVADVQTGAVVATATLDPASCALPHEATFASDASALYLLCEGNHTAPGTVLALVPQTLAVKGKVAVG